MSACGALRLGTSGTGRAGGRSGLGGDLRESRESLDHGWIRGGLTLLQQGSQDAGDLQEDSSATAGVHGAVHPAVPVVSVQHIAVWRE